MAVYYCKIKSECEHNPDGARIYELSEIMKNKLQRELVVCPLCQTPMYIYDGKCLKHYPNRPHTLKICSKLSSLDTDYDRKNFDIEKFVAKISAIRKKKEKISKSVDVSTEGEQNDDIIDQIPFDDLLEKSSEELIELFVAPEKEDDTDTENASGTIEPSQDAPKDTTEEFVSEENPEGLDQIWEEIKALKEERQTEQAWQKEEEKQIDGQITILQLLEDCDSSEIKKEEPGEKNKTNEIKNKNNEIKIVKINNIDDLYRAGYFRYKALDVVRTDSDGTKHYTYEFAISKRNWSYVFRNNLFHGGSRAIELYYDGYHEGRYLYGENHERTIDTSYIVFRSSWTEQDKETGTEQWRNVRFLIYYEDPNDYQRFLEKYLFYDGENNRYVEKEKGRLYCVIGVFHRIENEFCEDHCFNGFLKNYKNRSQYCDSCCQKYIMCITNFENQITYAEMTEE